MDGPYFQAVEAANGGRLELLKGQGNDADTVGTKKVWARPPTRADIRICKVPIGDVSYIRYRFKHVYSLYATWETRGESSGTHIRSYVRRCFIRAACWNAKIGYYVR